MAFKALSAAALSLGASLAAAQNAPAAVHNTGFNSSFTLTPSQIASAHLDDALVESIQNTMDFDHTQLAFGGPGEDDFYSLPPLTNETHLEPGQILKVQPFTDPTEFAIPPGTALSRILYTTTDYNGTVIPTSGFILWPYTPRQFGSESTGKASVVVWTHGTSGFFGPQAPSAHRALWYEHQGPFALAQAGYAVVAPDYSALGVPKSWDGRDLAHPYNFSPVAALDALYGLRAALEAFPDELEPDFVVMGHSEGGGAAWGVAEALVSEADKFEDLSPGYKGAIAASPTTDVFSGPPFFMIPTVGLGIHTLFPDFRLEDWLTPLGVARTELVREIQGSIPVLMQLHSSENENDTFVRPDWDESWYADAYAEIANAGRKDFKGPLLVLQGTEDLYVPYEVTAKTVEATWDLYPENDLEFLVVSGIGHNPVMTAARYSWLQWIDDRFEGKALKNKGSARTDLTSLRPIEQYLNFGNSLPLWAGLPEFWYETPLSV